MEVDRLVFVHKNYFYGDAESNLGKLIYEISFFFYMKVPEGFEPRRESLEAEGRGEYLEWVSPDTKKTIYPFFFRTELDKPCTGARHILTDERAD